MTDAPEDITARAARLLANVTPGAWGWEDLGDAQGLRLGNDESEVISAQPIEWREATINITDADAAFIAAAPVLVRGLLAEVARLRALVGESDGGNE